MYVFAGRRKKSSISSLARSSCQLLPSTSSISVTQRTSLMDSLTEGEMQWSPLPPAPSPQPPNPSSQHTYKVKYASSGNTPCPSLSMLYKLKIHLSIPGAKTLQELEESDEDKSRLCVQKQSLPYRLNEILNFHKCHLPDNVRCIFLSV